MGKKRVLILGGGMDQKLLVDMFQKRGFYTIIVDYYPNPPAKAAADKHYQVSTYDTEAVLNIARAEKVSFVTTISTDQPLLVAAYVSEKLGLRFNMNYEQALITTNKAHMKRVLMENSIPTSKYLILKDHSDIDQLQKISFPAVMKPVDSSGSRGVFVLDTPDDAVRHLESSLSISSSKNTIVEEYVKGTEISVDAFIENGDCKVILTTENQKMKGNDSTPLCYCNFYPTVKVSKKVEKKVERICRWIGNAFELNNTPLFVQMMVTDDGDVKVIEFSARIAGGSKPYFIPMVTGIDLVDIYVSMLLQEKTGEVIQCPLEGVASLNFLYCNAGVFQRFEGHEALLKNGIIDQLFQYKSSGSFIKGICDGSDRVGAFFVTAPELNIAKQKSRNVYEQMKALDERGRDILYHKIADFQDIAHEPCNT